MSAALRMRCKLLEIKVLLRRTRRVAGGSCWPRIDQYCPQIAPKL
jgi:hypothetical protein